MKINFNFEEKNVKLGLENQFTIQEFLETTPVKILMLKGEKGDTVSAEWGTITGDIADQTDLASALDTKADTTDIPDVSHFITKDVDNLTNYTDTTTLNNALNGKADIEDIPDVSSFITKDVNNLTNYTKTSDLSTVATSGSYNDLSNKPTIPSKTSDLTNDSGFIDNTVDNLTNYTKTSDLSTVAISGDYDDLDNKPTIPSYSKSTYTSNGISIRFEKFGRIVQCTFEGTASSNLTANTDYNVSISSAFNPKELMRTCVIFNETGTIGYVWVDASQSKIYYRVKSTVSSPSYPRFSFTYISAN